MAKENARRVQPGIEIVDVSCTTGEGLDRWRAWLDGHSMTEFPVLNALVFAALGVLVFVIALAIVAKLAPFHVWKEIVEERNVAAAILAGAVALGLCWIIAAAMH